MKKAILGFIAGLTVAITCSGFAQTAIQTFTAEKATFDVVVNGEELKSDKPPVVIDGSTYLPLKVTGEALGVDVNWNNSLGRVEIGDMEETPLQEASPSAVLIQPQTTESTIANEDVEIKILSSRQVGASEPSNAFPVPGCRYVQVEIAFTNNSNSVIALKNIDFTAKYKVKNLNSTSIANLLAKYPDGIIDAGYITANNIPSISGEDLATFKFSPLAPGETRTGTILFNESNRCNTEWFKIIYKDTLEIQSHY